jgi:hypothetical protein
MADCHSAHVLTSGIALYMHLTTAYATSRAVVSPAIAISIVQSYTCISVTSFSNGASGLKNHVLFTVTLNFQFHASAVLYRVKEHSVPNGTVVRWAVACQVTALHVKTFLASFDLAGSRNIGHC